jgi:DNA processing protein
MRTAQVTADPDEERAAWLVLASVHGVGDHTFGRLLAQHGSIRRVLKLAADECLPANLEPGDVIPRRMSDGLLRRIALASRGAAQILRRIDELGVWTLTSLDAAYPERLRILDPPPPVLYGWGAPGALAHPRAVAIVGTRRPTLHGRAFAARIATRLVECGASVVSGLAIGIDGAAQAAAVEAGGRTVSVLGSGHAAPGPRAHRALMRRIVADGGAVISELAPDATATRGTFPRRNRLISALGDAVVVVEAPERSGALITARHALEQGREVFAVPGRPTDSAAAGCLALLRETPARVVVGLDELTADLGFLAAAASASPDADVGSSAAAISRDGALALLGPPERAVASLICDAPGGLDALVAGTGFTPGTVAAAVTFLQLRGWVQQIGAAYMPAGPLLTGR